MLRSLIIIFLILLLLGGMIFLDDALNYLRGIRPVISRPFVPPESLSPLSSPSLSVGISNLPTITKDPNPDKLELMLPPGFAIKIFAKNLGNPRVLSFDPYGNLLVSIPSEGRVVALRDQDGDGRSDLITTVIAGLTRPHGLAWRENKLYVAETDKVVVYDYTPELRAINGDKIVDLPHSGGHFTRTLLFRGFPDEDELLISVGSSCNVCYETDPRRAKILSFNIKTKILEDFAVGLRNAVFMNLHPITGDVWVTEMGRDLLGDDIPPDEINVIKKGKNYGWPICFGKNIHDEDFDKNIYIRNPCQEPFQTPSHIDIQAHSAPLGFAFIPEEGFPEEWWYDLIVAYHGSWNRSIPTGYKLVRMKLDAKGNFEGTEDFITGWLKGNEAWGRPADVLVLPGGNIYISDDKAGLIYLVTPL